MSASSRNRSSRSGTPEAPKTASPRPASAARTSATARSCERRCTALWYNRGVSALRLFRPVLAVALTITAVTAGLTLVANPFANREFQRQLFKILQSRAVSSLQERVFNNTFGDVIIYVEDVSASQVALRGLLVSDERDPTLSRIITAREGRLLTDEVSQRITLRLLNGA